MKLKILLVLFIMPTITIAGVNLRNGDFYITYDDVVENKINENHKLVLERTYNSKSWQIGWFGRGWGSTFETHLTVMPDGTAVVQENGSGQLSYYRPTKTDIDSGVTRIVKTITERDKLSPDTTETLHKELIGDEELRMLKVHRYGIESDLPEKTVLYNTIFCGKTELVREKDSYKRGVCDNSKDYFDLQGHLIRHETSDGYVLNINYEGKYPTSLKDSLGQTINLKSNEKGLIVEANGSEATATYRYDADGNMLQIHNVTASDYNYKYDSHHNMTQIGYAEGTTMFIDYYTDAKYKDWVHTVTEKNREKTLYEYRSDPQDSNHNWTKVTEFAVSGEQVASKEFEFQNQITETGAVQLQQIATSDDKKRTTDTKYDDKQRVISKRDQDGEIIEFTYNPQNGKIATALKNQLKTEFSYDKSGNLTHIKNSDGQKIDLDYNRNSTEIRRLVESNSVKKTKNELTFKYNAAKQPIEISMAGVGKVIVEYDAKGEISKVQSKKGETQIALKITEAFLNLQQAIRLGDN
jgi:YD repeat-containing protein